MLNNDAEMLNKWESYRLEPGSERRYLTQRRTQEAAVYVDSVDQYLDSLIAGMGDFYNV